MNIDQQTYETIGHYESDPEGFWLGTKDHDVSQNYQALLNAISTDGPFTILDLGCGPGRDLSFFKSLGHAPVGLDGCESFCRMAREETGCEVLMQNFIDLKLKANYFDGIFANASLFHVPKSQLPQVIEKLQLSLKREGVLFSSNPRGTGDGMSGSRYGNYMELGEYQEIVEKLGFTLIHHYYRPDEIPVDQRPWLACIFRKNS